MLTSSHRLPLRHVLTRCKVRGGGMARMLSSSIAPSLQSTTASSQHMRRSLAWKPSTSSAVRQLQRELQRDRRLHHIPRMFSTRATDSVEASESTTSVVSSNIVSDNENATSANDDGVLPPPTLSSSEDDHASDDDALTGDDTTIDIDIDATAADDNADVNVGMNAEVDTTPKTCAERLDPEGTVLPTSSWIQVDNISPTCALEDIVATFQELLDEAIDEGIVDLDAIWDPERDASVPTLSHAMAHIEQPSASSLQHHIGSAILKEQRWIEAAHTVISLFARPRGWRIKFRNRSVANAVLTAAQQKDIMCLWKMITVSEWRPEEGRRDPLLPQDVLLQDPKRRKRNQMQSEGDDTYVNSGSETDTDNDNVDGDSDVDIEVDAHVDGDDSGYESADEDGIDADAKVDASVDVDASVHADDLQNYMSMNDASVNDESVQSASSNTPITPATNSGQTSEGKMSATPMSTDVPLPLVSDSMVRFERFPSGFPETKLFRMLSRYNLTRKATAVTTWHNKTPRGGKRQTHDGKTTLAMFIVEFEDATWARAAVREMQNQPIDESNIMLVQYPKQIVYQPTSGRGGD